MLNGWYLVVDRLAGLLETISMVALGLAKRCSDEPVMQVDDVIDQRGARMEVASSIRAANQQTVFRDNLM